MAGPSAVFPPSPVPLATGVTGTLPVANGGTNKTAFPNFSAYRGTSNQTIAASSYAEIVFNAENWDVGACFNTTTGRFTPNVAGKYRVSAMVTLAASGGGTGSVSVYFRKNGAFDGTMRQVWHLQDGITDAKTAGYGNSAVFDMNGSSDYISIWAATEFNSIVVQGQEYLTFFQGELLISP